MWRQGQCEVRGICREQRGVCPQREAARHRLRRLFPNSRAQVCGSQMWTHGEMEQKYQHVVLNRSLSLLSALHQSPQGQPRRLRAQGGGRPPARLGGGRALQGQGLRFLPREAPLCRKRELWPTCFTTSTALPTFRTPNATTCPRGSQFAASPECHTEAHFKPHRGAGFPTDCKARLAPETRDSPLPAPSPSAFLGLESQAATCIA